MRQEWKEALLSMKRGLAIFLAIAMVFGGTDMTAFANWYDMDQNQKLDYDDIFGYHESYYESIYADVGDSVVLDIAEYIYKMTNYRIYRGDDDFSYDESEIYDSKETTPLGSKPELLNYTWTKDVWDSGDTTDGEDLGTGSVWRISSVTEEDYNYCYSCHVKADGIDEELAVFRFELNKYPEDGEYRGYSWKDYYANPGESITLKPDLSELERYNRANDEWEEVTDYSNFTYKWFRYGSEGSLVELAATEEYETEPFTEDMLLYYYHVYENGNDIMEGVAEVQQKPSTGWFMDTTKGSRCTEITDTVRVMADETFEYRMWNEHLWNIYYCEPETYDTTYYGSELNIVWKKAGKEISSTDYFEYTPTQEDIDAGQEFVCEFYLTTTDQDTGETSKELLPLTYRVKLVQAIAEGTIRCSMEQNEVVCAGAIGESLLLSVECTFQQYLGWNETAEGIEDNWGDISPSECSERIKYRWTREGDPDNSLSNKANYEISELKEDDFNTPYIAEVYIDGELAARQKCYIKSTDAASTYEIVVEQEEVQKYVFAGDTCWLYAEDAFDFYQIYEDGKRRKIGCSDLPGCNIQWYEKQNPTKILLESGEYSIEPVEEADFQKIFCCSVTSEATETVTADFKLIDEGSVPLKVENSNCGYAVLPGSQFTFDLQDWYVLYTEIDGNKEGKSIREYTDRLQFAWYEQDNPNELLSDKPVFTIDQLTEKDFPKTYYCMITVKNAPPEEDSVGKFELYLNDGSGSFSLTHEIVGGEIFASPGDEITLQPKVIDKKTGDEVSAEEYSGYEYYWYKYSFYSGGQDSISNEKEIITTVDGEPGREYSSGETLEYYNVSVYDSNSGSSLYTSFNIFYFTEDILTDAYDYEWSEGTVTREPTGERTGLMVFEAQSPDYPNYFAVKSIPVLVGDEKDAYDKATAEAVAEMINNLPDDPGTEDADQIEAARNAFCALTDDQIAILGDDYASLSERLEAVEDALEQAQLDAENQAAADEVKQMIEALDENSEDYEYEVQEARDAYNALTLEQQALIADAYEDLEAAEQKIADAKDAENKAVADEVKMMIENLDPDSNTFEQDVKKAREAFDDLTEEQREKLGEATLEDLENTLLAMESRRDEIINDPQKAEAVEKMIRALKPEEDGSYDADAVKEARAAFSALSKVQKEMVPKDVKDMLRTAENAVEAAEDEKNLEAAEAVEDLIQKLKEDAGLDDEADVAAAQEAYDNLTKAQKYMVNRDLVRKLEKAAASVETAKAKKAAEEEAAKKAAEEEAAKKAAEEAAAKKAAEEAAKKAAEEAAAKKAAEEAAKKAAAIKKVTSITITSNASNKIAAGKKVKLQAEVLPADAANKAVTWSSSNPKVAKVDANGVVTVLKKTGGRKAVITATAADGSGVTQTFKITSMKGVVKKVKISGKKTVKAGKTLKLKAKVTATKKANKKIAWESSNTEYATVKNGKVKALKAGKGKKVTITAKATDGSGKKAKIKIKIK